MTIDIGLVQKSLPDLLHGLLVTMKIALYASTMGIVGGTVLGLLHSCGNSIIKALITVLVILIRGTPMLIQILFAFYVLPHIGIVGDAFWIAVIAIGINSSIYISQIIKAGIISISKGQWEACHVLGLSWIQTVRYIILPQAMVRVLPALGNEFITLIKDSSLASIIGVAELSRQGRIIISRSYDAITIFTTIAILYLIVTTTISLLLYLLEQRTQHHAKH